MLTKDQPGGSSNPKCGAGIGGVGHETTPKFTHYTLLYNIVGLNQKNSPPRFLRCFLNPSHPPPQKKQQIRPQHFAAEKTAPGGTGLGIGRGR